jgi:hypothetical protein
LVGRFADITTSYLALKTRRTLRRPEPDRRGPDSRNFEAL